jgi:hypothetical protein
MAGTTDLSPFVHPKAQKWFRALLQRTSLPMALEDELRRPDDQLNLEIVRMILAFAVLLGRPGIWPENENDVLKFIVKRANEFSKMSASSTTGTALTLAEHQAHTKTISELTQEMELVRRRLGISVRKTKISTPRSWAPFWE